MPAAAASQHWLSLKIEGKCAPGRSSRRAFSVQSAASNGLTPGTFAAPCLPEPLIPNPSIVVLGGTGRVGASTAAALLRALPSASLTLASRSKASFDEAIARRPELKVATHKITDVNNPASLEAVLRGADLVIHAAGPFQRRQTSSVLEAAIAVGVPYMDVCDDTQRSCAAKALHDKAVAAGVPAITSAGIYPGVSNVMAAHMLSIGQGEYASDFSTYVAPPEGAAQPKRVLYSYYTAGSGGAGPTILDTTFLLAGEEVRAFKDGEEVVLPSVSNRRVVDFGPGVGRKGVWLYPLPEVWSGRQVFGVPSISARFGTDPDVWNWAMWALARLAPKSFLQNPASVKTLSKIVDPLVRAVDGMVGERVAMLVEAELSDGKIAAGLFVHDKLSESVGICTAAFARCMLAGQTAPGVWWPEEQGALSDRRALLQMSSEGTKRFLLNKPPWAIESDPVQIALGFYW